MSTAGARPGSARVGRTSREAGAVAPPDVSPPVAATCSVELEPLLSCVMTPDFSPDEDRDFSLDVAGELSLDVPAGRPGGAADLSPVAGGVSEVRLARGGSRSAFAVPTAPFARGSMRVSRRAPSSTRISTLRAIRRPSNMS